MDDLREQFSQIYDQYIGKIYRFVYLKVNSRETAEDLTSKVFMRGWEAYQKSQCPMPNAQKPIENIGAFLYQIARNAVVDYYRERGRVNTVSSEIVPEIVDPADDAHEKAVLSADIGIVKACIPKLKQEHQDVIIWHYLEDMPVKEIAVILGKPAGTVRVMLHRGLKELKGLINES